MVRRRRGAWLAAALAGLLLGCANPAPRPPYPPDPMFVARKPVPGDAAKARPLLAHSEPVVPPPPDTALASAPPQRLATLKASLTARPVPPPDAVQTSGADPAPPDPR